jgi:hypothetical protein
VVCVSGVGVVCVSGVGWVNFCENLSRHFGLSTVRNTYLFKNTPPECTTSSAPPTKLTSITHSSDVSLSDKALKIQNRQLKKRYIF